MKTKNSSPSKMASYYSLPVGFGSCQIRSPRFDRVFEEQFHLLFNSNTF